VETLLPLEKVPPLPEVSVREEKLPAWLTNVNRAARRLTQLSVESASQGALITNEDQLWAYAGQLPRQAARELAATVIRYWDRDEQNDLVRFVRLVSTQAEHMLYATRLAANMVLALVFDAETPYSMIRSQAGQLKHTLSMVSDEGDRTEAGDSAPPDPVRSFLAQVTPKNEPAVPSTEKPGENERDAQLEDALRRLFLTVPPGDENDASQPYGANHIAPVSAPALFQRFTINSGKLEAQPSTPTKPETGQVDTEHGFEPMEDGSQGSLPVPRRLVLEPATASVYNLDYVCLLIPRLSHNLLTGDLSERLGDWLPQICQAFYWRLEYLSIRPEYIQWIANVPPATSPAYFMRILRQLTSEKIFLEFPRYKRENPSGDFWAPGYLIMGGSQPPPAQLIKDYIAQTRQRQGGSHTFES
jgi:REP element-mobilizing transposase RayT